MKIQASLLNRITLSVVPLKSAIKALFIYRVRYTPRRLWNLVKIISSMYASKILHKPIVWGYPPTLMVEPTNICNLKCPMCPSGNGDMKRPRGKLDLAHLKKLLDEVGPQILQIQFWNQGEPFINSAFLDCVRYAKQMGLMTMTSTNGHFIRSDEMAGEVVASGLDQIIFSMDGTNQQTYEKYRVGGNYQLVMETLERLSRAKDRLASKTPLIELQFLVFKHNQDEMEAIIKIAKKNKVNRLAFKTAQVYSADQARVFLPEDDRYKRYNVAEQSFVLKSKIPNWCKRLWLNPAINWDGTVSPCCFDKDAEFAFANLFENDNSFKMIWKNEKFMDFRRSVLRHRRDIEMCCNCTEGINQSYAQIIEITDR